ncbi:hypothetical protein DITRI_Ditri01bG0082800 [Diplodiscus trichospermus]
MAPKVKTMNKKKQALPKKEANSTARWPDLPQKLVDIIAKQPAIMRHISYGGLTKFCRAPTGKCNHNYSPPCLQLFDEINNGNNEENYVELEPNQNASLNRFGGFHYALPEWDKSDPVMRVAIGNSFHKKCTVMVLTGNSHPAFPFCCLNGGRREWAKQDCKLTERHCWMKSEGRIV